MKVIGTGPTFPNDNCAYIRIDEDHARHLPDMGARNSERVEDNQLAPNFSGAPRVSSPERA